ALPLRCPHSPYSTLFRSQRTGPRLVTSVRYPASIILTAPIWLHPLLKLWLGRGEKLTPAVCSSMKHCFVSALVTTGWRLSEGRLPSDMPQALSANDRIIKAKKLRATGGFPIVIFISSA